MNESRARDIIGLTTEKLNEDLVRKLYKNFLLYIIQIREVMKRLLRG